MTLARRRAILWPRFGRERQFPGHRMAVAGRSTILWMMTDALLDEEGHPIGHSTPHKPEYHVHFATDPDLGNDLYVRLICSR